MQKKILVCLYLFLACFFYVFFFKGWGADFAWFAFPSVLLLCQWLQWTLFQGLHQLLSLSPERLTLNLQAENKEISSYKSPLSMRIILLSLFFIAIVCSAFWKES